MLDIKEICIKAKNASYLLSQINTKTKNEILLDISDSLILNESDILEANRQDVLNFPKDHNQAFLDRLKLTPQRIRQMAEGVRKIIKLDDPVGLITQTRVLENGLILNKVRVPLGVIGIIYESRPNVTIDAVALCIKSGNACILRGGSESINTNTELYNIIKKTISKSINSDIVQFVSKTDRIYALELLSMKDYIDVIITRGGNSLKEIVLNNAKMPVIVSAGGICHTYIEKTADLKMAIDIIINAKTSRPGVCNATETLLVDQEIASEFLPKCLDILSNKGVEIRGDNKIIELFKKTIFTDNYDIEYESLILAVKIVKDYKEAVEHINKHNTKHSDAIVTNDEIAKKYFANNVDSAAIYINASTRFTDGYEFGLGAEMAISTQKLHVRGPIGLEALTSEKYILYGNGQIR